MKKTFVSATPLAMLLAAGIALMLLTPGKTVLAQEAAAENSQAGLTRSEVESIVHEYLMANPEVLLEMQSRLEAKQQDERKSAARQALAEYSGEIFHDPSDGVVGNPDGDVTVVEFFDYNCGYCRRALSDMTALVESDENLRFVLKEFPILGPESQQAHVVSMAFKALAPEQYGTFHNRLLSSEGRANEETAIAIARDLGVDEETLREEMQNPEIAATINQTYELANHLQISGTPSYVVGDELVFGAVGREQLAEKIEEARQ